MKMILGNSKTFVLDAIYRVSTLDSYRDSATPYLIMHMQADILERLNLSQLPQEKLEQLKR
ncbi:hypothetical protein B4U84_00260 [Westiellopsis prolifica IICB1]|nr:hypothetical protein B4U84_00260 [Westiellopsis prolifica IICB1]